MKQQPTPTPASRTPAGEQPTPRGTVMAVGVIRHEPESQSPEPGTAGSVGSDDVDRLPQVPKAEVQPEDECADEDMPETPMGTASKLRFNGER